MVDLAGQLAAIRNEVDVAVNGVLSHTQFINGPEVKFFEKNLANYLHTEHVIACANGTDALQIALMALDLHPGDEVITPSFTYAATVEVVALLGLKPVFVEVDADTFNMSTANLQMAISERTKAIVPVHLYGQCANMAEILRFAAEYNLHVIEDTAQAIGASCRLNETTWAKAGTIGHIGTTSFFPSKNLGCFGDGGAIFTNDNLLAQKIRAIANHGQSQQYHHDIVGVNSRLDSLQAAILNVKLKYLDNYNSKRQTVAKYYNSAFAGNPQISTPYLAPHSTHVYHQYTLQLHGVERDIIRQKLSALGIPTMIYYPIPNHRQNAYAKSAKVAGDLSNTEKLCKSVLSLPIHTEMTETQLEFITSSVLEVLKQA